MPEFLPAITPEPPRAKRIPFLRALVSHGLFPKQAPRLASGTLTRAVGAALISLTLTAMLGAVAYSVLWILPHASLEQQVNETIRSATTVSATEWGWSVLSALMLVGGLVVVAGIITTPFAAGGDRYRSALLRSVKNTLWATTALPWLGVFAVVACYVHQVATAQWENGQRAWAIATASDNVVLVCAVVVAGVFLLARIWIASVGKYVGPAVGPGFERRRPVCETCGYILSGLLFDSKCPECGRPVASSLPGGVRSILGNELGQLAFRRPIHFLRLWAEFVRDGNSLCRVPVHDHAAGHRFYALMYVYFVLLALVVHLPAWGIATLLGNQPAQVFTRVAIVIVLATPLVHIVGVYFVSQLGLLVFRIRDVRVCVTVANYAAATPSLIAMMAILHPLLLFIPGILEMKLRLPGGEIEVIFIPSVITELLMLVLGGLWLFRVVRGLRAATFANS